MIKEFIKNYKSNVYDYILVVLLMFYFTKSLNINIIISSIISVFLLMIYNFILFILKSKFKKAK